MYVALTLALQNGQIFSIITQVTQHSGAKNEINKIRNLKTEFLNDIFRIWGGGGAGISA